jgi:amidase
MSELWRLTLTQLAARIRSGEVSARAAVEAIIARIEAINPRVTAITVVHAEEARAAADAADARYARGGPLPPLHGLPFTVKENIDVQGWATTQGVPMLAQNIAAADAPVVAQLRAAGAIPIAGTNLPDFALRWHSESSLRGTTRNPWNAACVAGGSSGGAAAALATGMGPLALGNDVGGSLRVPAQYNGICSLKPSLGRMPRHTAGMPEELPLSFQLFYVEGPMARSVADLRLVYPHMSGPDVRDPWWTPMPLAGAPPPRPVRVAVCANPARGGIDPQVAAGVRRAADALAAAGYAVEEAEPPRLPDLFELWRRLLFADVRGLMMPMIRALVSPTAMRSLDLFGPSIPDIDRAEYMRLFAARTGYVREWLQFLQRFPVVLGPVSTAPPFPVGADVESGERAVAIMYTQRLVVALNALCFPVVVVPVGVADGLPQAVQLAGGPGREDLLLDAGEALERVLGAVTPIDPR